MLKLGTTQLTLPALLKGADVQTGWKFVLTAQMEIRNDSERPFHVNDQSFAP